MRAPQQLPLDNSHPKGKTTTPTPKEACDCNSKLNANGSVYLAMCLVVVICSTGFLCGSIYVYYSVAELLLSQLQEAEKNAHDVMDAILAVLIPDSLLNDIAEKKKHK
ncbi:hypothetical protein Ddc_06322 [Ditylenchus destructor]|nr:hypothetical protein Ddc_06322 [Ditylenchus destructor]